MANKSSRIKYIESFIESDFLGANDVGSQLRNVGKFDFGKLFGIQQAYICAFGGDVKHYFSDAGLEVVHGIRNVLVHAGGRVDRAYRVRVKRNRKHYASFWVADLPLGTVIPLDGELCRNLADSTSHAAMRLLQFVDTRLVKISSKRSE